MKSIFYIILLLLGSVLHAQKVLTNKGDIVDLQMNNSTTPSASDLTDNSTRLIVIKHYLLKDWAGDRGYFNTGFSTSKWEAFIGGAMVITNRNRNPHVTPFFFSDGSVTKNLYRVMKSSDGNTWLISGDIQSLTENAVMSVMFVSKKVVVADAPQPDLPPYY